MSNVSGVGSSHYDNYDKKDGKQFSIDDISSVFATDKKEEKRTTFNESFNELSLDDKKAKQGKRTIWLPASY